MLEKEVEEGVGFEIIFMDFGKLCWKEICILEEILLGCSKEILLCCSDQLSDELQRLLLPPDVQWMPIEAKRAIVLSGASSGAGYMATEPVCRKYERERFG